MYRTTKRILIGLGALLLFAVLVIRLYADVWLLGYVNNVLAHIKGYRGHVASISIDLYRGAYRIHGLVLDKEEGRIPTPFIAIQEVEFSVEWRALLHRRIVSKAVLTRPVINFAVKDNAKQTGAGVDWTRPIKDLMPIDINYVRFVDGSVTYQDFASNPRINIYIRPMQGEVRNLRNVENANEPLPSTLHIHGTSIGGGTLDVQGRMNILKQVPDMNILATLEKVDLTALNDYSQAYASFDFKSGIFNLYTNIVTKNGQVSGYVKPIADHLSVNVLDKQKPLDVAWSAVVTAIIGVFTNAPHDQFATRADLTGDLKNVDIDFWSVIVGIFHNAFIEAMSHGLDQSGQVPNKP